MLQGNANTNKRIPLAAFMKWPLAKRQDFINREMSGCPEQRTSLRRGSSFLPLECFVRTNWSAYVTRNTTTYIQGFISH